MKSCQRPVLLSKIICLSLPLRTLVMVPEYTAPSNIFSPMDAGHFKQTLHEALGNHEFFRHLLDRQREHARVATPEDYQKVIG